MLSRIGQALDSTAKVVWHVAATVANAPRGRVAAGRRPIDSVAPATTTTLDPALRSPATDEDAPMTRRLT